jgi:hypothetical protein
MNATKNRMAYRLGGSLLVAVVTLLAVALVGRPQPSRATVSDGDVVLGTQANGGCTPGVDPNCETATTGIFDQLTNGDTAFAAIASTSGTGVYAHSVTGYGVEGTTTSGAGVHGTATDPTGIGVLADGPTGLKVNGPAVFSRSGDVTIPLGASSARVRPIKLTASSLVLATIQGNVAGVYVRGVTIVTGASGSFTVHLNKAAPSAVHVGWFAVN